MSAVGRLGWYGFVLMLVGIILGVGVVGVVVVSFGILLLLLRSGKIVLVGICVT